jgi:hypothetical protein
VKDATAGDTPEVSGVPIRFTLDDGELLVVPAAQLGQVYELLWLLAAKPGAISMAAVIRGATRDSARYSAPLDLTAAQSAALRDALALLPDEPS